MFHRQVRLTTATGADGKRINPLPALDLSNSQERIAISCLSRLLRLPKHFVIIVIIIQKTWKYIGHFNIMLTMPMPQLKHKDA